MRARPSLALLPALLLHVPALAQFDDVTVQTYVSPCIERSVDAGLGSPRHVVVSEDWIAYLYNYRSNTEMVLVENRTTGSCQRLSLEGSPFTSPVEFELLDFIDVEGDTLAVQVRYWSPGVSVRPAVLVFREAGGRWSFDFSIEPGPGYIGAGLDWGGVAIDGDRMVVLNAYEEDPVTGELGQILTYDKDASGAWTFSGATEGTLVRSDGTNAYDPTLLIALDGDTLVAGTNARVGQAAGATVFRWSGTQWVATGFAAPNNNVVESVAIDGDRVVFGSFYDATVDVFRLDASGAATHVQTLNPDQLSTRDFNPPYAALVAVEDGELVVGVREHFLGYAPLTRMRWFQGAYRAYELTRGYDGIQLVSLRSGQLLVGVSQYLTPNTAPEFNLRAIGESRAVPFCETGIELALSGSGLAPLDGAHAHGYGFPAGQVVRLFAGLDAAPSPVGALGLCIASGGAAPVLDPFTADSAGRFVESLAGLELGSAGPVLTGANFALQAVTRDASGLAVSNAQWVEVR